MRPVGAKAVIRPIRVTIRAASLDRDAYRRRNRIELLLWASAHPRAVATRYDKHDANFLALVKLAATRIWLRIYEFQPRVEERETKLAALRQTIEASIAEGGARSAEEVSAALSAKAQALANEGL